MGSYVPGTKQEQQEMLREIGYASFEEMFSHIPDEVMLKPVRMLCSAIFSGGQGLITTTYLPLFQT